MIKKTFLSAASLDWTAALPKFDEPGEAISFFFPEPLYFLSQVHIIRREFALTLALVTRQFCALSLLRGLQPVIQEQSELRESTGLSRPEARVQAYYGSALIAMGVNEFALNLNVHLSGIVEEGELVEIRLSPLHQYALWFCARTLRIHYLSDCVEQNPKDYTDWAFEELATTREAAAKVELYFEASAKTLLRGFDPFVSLATRTQLERLMGRLSEEGKGSDF